MGTLELVVYWLKKGKASRVRDRLKGCFHLMIAVG